MNTTPGLRTGPREVGVLGQEAVTGMDRLAPVLARDREDARSFR